MPYSLTIDLNKAVEDFAPDLTSDEVDSIAHSIYNEFNYSPVYDTIEKHIIAFVEDNDIAYEIETIADEIEHESIDREDYR